jgi:hypothetical protein
MESELFAKMKRSEDLSPSDFLMMDQQDQNSAECLDLLNEEINRGHYYSDSNQFHDHHRQFQDQHLTYTNATDEIKLDKDIDLVQMRVYEILRRIELSITLDS